MPTPREIQEIESREGEIELIPRARGRMSARGLQDYAKVKCQAEETAVLKDRSQVKRMASGYEETIRKQREAAGLN
jgi:hypothetical protein